MIKLTALWTNKDKEGKTYLSGYLGDTRLVVFTNGYKKQEKEPDWIVYVDEKKKPESSDKTANDVDF